MYPGSAGMPGGQGSEIVCQSVPPKRLPLVRTATCPPDSKRIKGHGDEPLRVVPKRIDGANLRPPTIGQAEEAVGIRRPPRSILPETPFALLCRAMAEAFGGARRHTTVIA